MLQRVEKDKKKKEEQTEEERRTKRRRKKKKNKRQKIKLALSIISEEFISNILLLVGMIFFKQVPRIMKKYQVLSHIW